MKERERSLTELILFTSSAKIIFLMRNLLNNFVIFNSSMSSFVFGPQYFSPFPPKYAVVGDGFACIPVAPVMDIAAGFAMLPTSPVICVDVYRQVIRPFLA